MNKLIFITIVLLSFKTEAQSSVLSIADSLYAFGNYTKAIKIYKNYPKQEDTYKKIAKAYVALGNYDEALAHYDSAIKSNNEDALLKYEYAKLLAKTKKYTEAENLLYELIDLDYKNPNFHYELGLVLEKTSDTLGKAQNRFYSAYQLDKTHQKAIYKIAKHHLVKRNHDAVTKYVDEGLQTYANNKELISLKAQNFYWQEDYKNAIVWFEKLIELNESSQFIYEKLSFCYSRMYNYVKAIEHCKIALKYEPKNTTNLYILGQMYERIDDFVNAEKYIKQSLELQDIPLDSEYITLAMVLNRQKKHSKAIKTLQKAIKENPSNIQSRFFMLTTKSAYYEDLDTKIKLHEDFITKYPKSNFTPFVEQLLDKLKEEKFMAKD